MNEGKPSETKRGEAAPWGRAPPKEEPRSLGDLLPELSHLPLDSPSGPLKTLLGLLGTS